MGKNTMLNLQNTFRKFISFILKRYNFFRLTFIVFSDFLITFSSIVMSIFIYTRIVYIPISWGVIYTIIFITFSIRVLYFVIFKIYNISFQHACALYIFKISSVIFISTITNYFILRMLFPKYWFLTISVLDVLFNITGSVCFRFSPLIYDELVNRMGEGNKNCLIYGCGKTGQRVIEVLKENKIKVKGFIDDNPNNLRKIIKGIKVLGTFEDLEKLTTKLKIDVFVITILSLDGEKIRDIKQTCSKLNIELKMIPSSYQVYNKDINQIASSIRSINYEDLLRRPVRNDNFDNLNEFFKSKTIFVTGAGSIGSELVRQLTNFDVREVVVLDNNELNLFNIENNIPEVFSNKIKLRLVDLKNVTLLKNIFLHSKPDYVFHTAAYKHVPIVEENACEGVYNNLLCLKNTITLSEDFKIKKFIFISTDKAVKPVNIMGATKKLGELYLKAVDGKNNLTSVAVRFGNVIGSSGSLIPKIIAQIQENKPVTLTHPEASRFFMLTSEAVFLILKATTMANGGEIFILDMGSPIKITDIARDVAGFYGKTLGKDIPFKYIGLRPGEKITEELIPDEEQIVYKDGMYVTTYSGNNHNFYENFLKDYDEILKLASNAKKDEMIALIHKYVNTYSITRRIL